MSTLNRALKSLQMIKFARTTPNFYWRSFLDPEADAYDAVKQEIFNKQDELSSDWTIKGHRVDPTKAKKVFDNALKANDALARRRRTNVFYSTPHMIGVGAGTLGGAGLGYWGSSSLSKALGLTPDKGGWRKWTGRGINLGGTLLGAATGASLGSSIGGNLYVNNENSDYGNNGTRVLNNLNRSLDSLVTDWGEKEPKNLDFVDKKVADNARAEAKKRKDNVTASRRSK